MRIRPVKVGLVALAIAIFLWGFAYKISRYQVHRTTLSRVSTFRLWDESRHIRAVVDVLRKAHADQPPNAADSLSTAQPTSTQPGARLIQFAVPHLPPQRIPGSTLPSRAPPAFRCSLA
ncbi:MAG TPA: hypothetical protein VKB38_06775 [Terracidiphilus sp.]|nr:hypothetical protein [Terracidiphilus sp.]